MHTATMRAGVGISVDATYSKVSWRLVPFLFLCYVVAYLDRVNVGFAKLQTLNDLKFSETIYGIGAVKDATQSTAVGMFVLAFSMALGAILVLAGVPKHMQR